MLERFSYCCRGLKIIRKSCADVTLIGFIESAEVQLFPPETSLEFHTAPVSPDEIELIAGAQICRDMLAPYEVNVNHDRYLRALQAHPVYVSQPSDQIEPLVVPSQPDADAQASARMKTVGDWEEAVNAGIDAHMEELVILPHGGDGDQNRGKKHHILLHTKIIHLV